MGNPEEERVKPAAEVYPKALSLGVMSKSFGMPGLRIGWIACQDKILLKKIVIALKNKEKILTRNNQIVAENLSLLDTFIERHHHLFSWARPEGECVGFIDYTSVEPVEHFTDRLINEQGVLLLPVSVYDHKSNYFRIGFGRKNMPEALDRLQIFLEH